MSTKLKAAILKAACAVARDIANDEKVTLDRANTLLRHVHESIQAGMTVDTVWAEIARDGGYMDKAAKLEGQPMGKLLQQYRSRHRKGEKLGANFGLGWSAFLADIERLAKDHRAPRPGKNDADPVVQTTDAGESEGSEPKAETKLAEIAIPAALARAIADKRMKLEIEKRIAFDAKLSAWVAGYGV